MSVAPQIARPLERGTSINLHSQQSLRNGYDRILWPRPHSKHPGHLGKAPIICPSRPQPIVVESLTITFHALKAPTYLSHPRCPRFQVPLLSAMSRTKRTLICQDVPIGWVHRPIALHLLVPLLPPEIVLHASAKVPGLAKKERTYSYILPRHPRLRIPVRKDLEFSPHQRHPQTIRHFLRR